MTQSIKPPRAALVGGFGYEVENKLTIEAKSSFALDKNSLGAFGETEISTPKVHTISGKFKF